MRVHSGPLLGRGRVQKCLLQWGFYAHKTYGGRRVQVLDPGKSCFQCLVLFPQCPWCPAGTYHYVPADCCPHCLACRSLQYPMTQNQDVRLECSQVKVNKLGRHLMFDQVWSPPGPWRWTKSPWCVHCWPPSHQLTGCFRLPPLLSDRCSSFLHPSNHLSSLSKIWTLPSSKGASLLL